MPTWSASPDSAARSYSISKSVNPYAMQVFDYKPATTYFDTLTITLSCADSFPTVANPLWAASCIVPGNGKPDSVFPLSVNAAGNATCVITGFQNRSEVLVIPTNGDPVAQGTATVSFSASALLPPLPPALAQPSNGAILQGVAVQVGWNASAAATLYAAQVSLSSTFANPFISQSGIASLSLTVKGLSPDTIYYWRVSAADAAGASAWFSVWSFKTGTTLAIFPNPAHIGGNANFVNFEGTGINRVRIYSPERQSRDQLRLKPCRYLCRHAQWAQMAAEKQRGQNRRAGLLPRRRGAAGHPGEDQLDERA